MAEWIQGSAVGDVLSYLLAMHEAKGRLPSFLLQSPPTCLPAMVVFCQADNLTVCTGAEPESVRLPLAGQL